MRKRKDSKDLTRRICIMVTPEQYQYLNAMSKIFGDCGISAYIRQLIERGRKTQNNEKEK